MAPSPPPSPDPQSCSSILLKSIIPIKHTMKFCFLEFFHLFPLNKYACNLSYFRYPLTCLVFLIIWLITFLQMRNIDAMSDIISNIRNGSAYEIPTHLGKCKGHLKLNTSIVMAKFP